MAIPISEYIEIATKSATGAVENRDFSGLVLTKNAMKTTVTSAYADIKRDYASGKSVALALEDVNACFDDGDLKTFAAQYFGYNGGNKKPTVLNVAWIVQAASAYSTTSAYKIGDRVTNSSKTYVCKEDCSAGAWATNESKFTECIASDAAPIDTFNRVVAETINFGSCTVLGVMAASAGAGVDFTNAQIAAVATANEALDANNVFIVCTTASNVATSNGTAKIGGLTSFDNLKYTHCFIGADKFGASRAMSWYALVNYDLANASASIDFKQFVGESAAVTDQATKRAYDNGRLNYIGKVQVYGTGLAFYQQGANMDGTDLGVIRDSSWIKGLITADYFNLQSSVQKIPANYVGAAMVRNIVVSAATKGIANGAILLDKPLDENTKAIINSYANNEMAANVVSSAGYYVDSKIVKNGSRYVCQYTLIYAKGDHIGKVEGQHVII